MSIKTDPSRDRLFGELAMMRLKESYMRPDETSPQERLAFVAEQFATDEAHAQRIYDYASRQWLSFSTPILAFGRAKRGLPISCFLTYMADSSEGLLQTLDEVNRLSMLGGGVGIHVAIRSADEKSVGVMPHLKVYDAASLAYRQGSTRRGSYAAFLDVSHPDIIPFVEMRKPTGDQNMKALNLHHGVNISDAFMEKVEASMRDDSYDDTWPLIDPASGKTVTTVSARDLWQRMLEMRMHTGEPYLVFTDTANRALPSWLAEKGLKINGSNLCTEIFLPTSAERTAVCCLSSVNLEYFDEWKDDQQFIPDAMEFLDNVLQYFIDHAPDQIGRAKFAAMREHPHLPPHSERMPPCGRNPLQAARALPRRRGRGGPAPLLALECGRAQRELVPYHGGHQPVHRTLPREHLPSGHDLGRLHHEEPLPRSGA